MNLRGYPGLTIPLDDVYDSLVNRKLFGGEVLKTHGGGVGPVIRFRTYERNDSFHREKFSFFVQMVLDMNEHGSCETLELNGSQVHEIVVSNSV